MFTSEFRVKLGRPSIIATYYIHWQQLTYYIHWQQFNLSSSPNDLAPSIPVSEALQTDYTAIFYVLWRVMSQVTFVPTHLSVYLALLSAGNLAHSVPRRYSVLVMAALFMSDSLVPCKVHSLECAHTALEAAQYRTISHTKHFMPYSRTCFGVVANDATTVS